MSENIFSTEAQQIAIDVVVYSLRETYVHLLDKKKELELLEQSQDVKDLIALAMIRLDTLAKVETKLLTSIKEEYAFVESSVGELRPGELTAMQQNRQSIFIGSIMQGLL